MLFLSSVAAVLAVMASAGTAILLADAAHRKMSAARVAAEQRFAAARVRADVWHISQNVTHYLLTGDEKARREFREEVAEGREHLENLASAEERQAIGQALDALEAAGVRATDARDAGGNPAVLVEETARARAAAVDHVKATENRLREEARVLDAGAARARRQSVAAGIVGGLAGVAATALLLLAARRRIMRSVREIQEQAAALGRGDLVEAARPAGGRDEIAAAQAHLAQGANQLGDLLRFLEQSTGAFDAAARHLDEKSRSLRESADRIEAGAADAEDMKQRGEEIERSMDMAGATTRDGVRRLQAVLEDTAATVQLAVALFPEIERLLAVREGMARIRELRLPEKTAAYMPWRAEYATGVWAMDEEHRELVRLINVTHSAMMRGEGLEEAVRWLLAYAEGHLRHEEEFIASIAYPDLPRHKAIHDRLLGRARELADALGSGRARPLDLLDFLREWLIGHIVAEDRLHGRHAATRGREENGARAEGGHVARGPKGGSASGHGSESGRKEATPAAAGPPATRF